jgi:hypothetical protein
LPNIPEMLFELEEADGAILVWQVSRPITDWWQAVNRGEITYDESSDCFVHPGATRYIQEGGVIGYMIDRRGEDFDGYGPG